uniref:Cilia- and flagella-associated protein 61 N-terminal domain-containing protein n=1 Tax=Echeneis naucrates TaxID=173247 RepID=A0A665ULD2_ECHNA
MRTITSDSGQQETVTVRRSESADAQGIDSLVSPSALGVFGRVNVIQLLEKANLAITLANEKDDIVAHASFFDHPAGDLVDQAHWDILTLTLEKNFFPSTQPVNTLFLHLFVTQTNFATASVKEIIRAVFNAIPELEHICLPLESLTDPGPLCVALICHRQKHCPRLHIRPARVEDHDDIMRILDQQTKQLSAINQPYFLAEVIEAQNEENRTAVCEVCSQFQASVSPICLIFSNYLNLLPTSCPEFPLLQSFLRVPARPTSSPLCELYMFCHNGMRSVILQMSSRCPQSLPCCTQNMTRVCLRQDVEYIRAHYNIENFIYFSHHRYEEHAQIRHFVLRPSFQHFSRHLFKEALRLAHRSCLHHRVYPNYSSQEVGAQGLSGPYWPSICCQLHLSTP